MKDENRKNEASVTQKIRIGLNSNSLLNILLFVLIILTIFGLLEIKEPSGETVCNSLEGKYDLDQEYIFSKDNDSRTIGTRGTTWHTKDNCIYDKKKRVYRLQGTDETKFDVEIALEDKFVRIATVVVQYDSEVLISPDGKLVDRVFYAATPVEDIKEENKTIYPKGKNGELSKNYDNTFISKKINNALKHRYNTHKEIQSRGCSPMLGKIGARTAIAFVCPHYTRVMVRSD